MSIQKWLKENGFQPGQYALARDLLMTGPRATPPTWRAIRKMLARLRRGDKPGYNGWGSWCAARKVK